MGRVTEVQRLRARVAELEQSVEAQVAERLAVILQAMRIARGDYLGKTPAQVRAAAVAAVRGHEAIEGRPDDYILAVWDHLQYSAIVDPVRQVLRSRAN